MVRLIYGPVSGNNPAYSGNCPHCCASIKFTVISPVLCPKCGEELPEFDLLDEGVDHRISYYRDV